MKTKALSLLSVVILSGVLVGCSSTGGVSKQTVGIVGGAVAGGVIGSAVTGNSAVGTIVGAAGGAYAGHVIAKHYQ